MKHAGVAGHGYGQSGSGTPDKVSESRPGIRPSSKLQAVLCVACCTGLVIRSLHTCASSWSCCMQGLLRWLAGRYASYDEFSFWRTEARRDHSKLAEQVDYLKQQVNSLTAKIGSSSPPCTPTRIIDTHLSPDVESMPLRHSSSPGTVVATRGAGLRKAPRKDLEETFNECGDAVPSTQLLPTRLARGSKSTGAESRLPKIDRHASTSKSPRTMNRGRKESRLAAGLKSPGTLSRGPKGNRQGHTPQRDPAMTAASLQGNVKRAKGRNGGEGKLANHIQFRSFNCYPLTGIYERHPIQCKHLQFQPLATNNV